MRHAMHMSANRPAVHLACLITLLLPLAAAGATPPPDRPIDGKNMLPALRGEDDEPLHRTLAWAGAQHDRKHNPHYGERAGHAEARAGWAVRHGPWKLINPGSGPQLYNIENDVDESDNYWKGRLLPEDD